MRNTARLMYINRERTDPCLNVFFISLQMSIILIERSGRFVPVFDQEKSEDHTTQVGKVGYIASRH